MKEINALRKRAIERRNRAIAKARADYKATLTRLAELEQDLYGIKPVAHKTVAACIDSVIPSDRAFTTADVMAGLEALDNGREWRKRSIDNHLSRLRERGIVKRVKRARKGNLAIYARADLDMEPVAFQDMELWEVMALILRDSDEPMTAIELTVALIEAGYETSMTRQHLRNTVGRMLAERGEFERDGEAWGLA